MTAKRVKGFNTMDLALPVASYYRTDPQIMKDVENMRTTAASRWARDDYSRSLSRFHGTEDNTSKFTILAQPKVEILRANSPTLKRLVSARVKLERYANSSLRMNSASRQSTRETPFSKSQEKRISIPAQPVHIPAQLPPPPEIPIRSQSNANGRALDKITYEKTWSLNGNMKQKCSLEIWLPKPSLDDDEDKNSSRETITELHTIGKTVQPIPEIRSRRSSIVKISATTVSNIETKSIEDVASKKSEPIVVPRIYHYGDYIMDLPEERPRSSKSVTTVKSDSAASGKSIRRQLTRPTNRRLSNSTHHSEEILRFGTVEVSTSAKTRSSQTRSTNAKPTNTLVISELMQKYSLIKKDHQQLTQTKLQLDKPNENSNVNKDQSPRTRPPLIPESTNLVPADHHHHPTVAVKKLVMENSGVRSVTEQTNNKLLERRATPRQPSHSDIYPHLRIFSLANQRQHRQSSATIPPAILPNVNGGKKIDELPRTLQRSKTLDVVLNIPTPMKIKSRVPINPDNLLQPRPSKQSALNLRPGQNYQRSTTTIPSNTVLIRFNHGTTERNYLVPD